MQKVWNKHRQPHPLPGLITVKFTYESNFFKSFPVIFNSKEIQFDYLLKGKVNFLSSPLNNK